MCERGEIISQLGRAGEDDIAILPVGEVVLTQVSSGRGRRRKNRRKRRRRMKRRRRKKGEREE